MRRRLSPAIAVLAVLAVALTLAGCTVTSQDDETASPTPSTPSSSPAPPTQPLPATLPVGHGDVGPRDVVWAQGGVLHVGTHKWDLSPLNVESFVVVPGGVLFLSGGQLWLTDLVKARATGVSAATRLVATADGTAVRVTAGNPATTHAWDTTTGRAVPLEDAPGATPEDRLGVRGTITLQPERSDVTASPTPRPARRGPGLYGILGGDGEPLVAFHAPSASRVPLRGVRGNGFELVRWTSGTTFYGLALDDGRPLAVLRCDLDAGSCTTAGRVENGQPLVFESGT